MIAGVFLVIIFILGCLVLIPFLLLATIVWCIAHLIRAITTRRVIHVHS